MDTASRIAQFEKMAKDDPGNDMAHFSLGSAYAQAGRHTEAADSFLRCVAINPSMSKAYQLAGQSYLVAGAHERAKDVLTEGYRVAASRGDRLPQGAIATMLEKLGVPLPKVEPKVALGVSAGPAPDGSFVCAKSGRPGTKMTKPPFKGPVGEWIYAHISQETFGEWIKQGTKVINELRLDLSRDEDSATYDRYMREYLGVDDAVVAQGA